MKQAQKQRHDIGDVITIEAAEMLYKKRGIAIIATDGRYVQIEKEPTSRPAK
jgi:hypothetical protein